MCEHSLTKLKIIMCIALGSYRHFRRLFELLSTCYSTCDVGQVTICVVDQVQIVQKVNNTIHKIQL